MPSTTSSISTRWQRLALQTTAQQPQLQGPIPTGIKPKVSHRRDSFFPQVSAATPCHHNRPRSANPNAARNESVAPHPPASVYRPCGQDHRRCHDNPLLGIIRDSALNRFWFLSCQRKVCLRIDGSSRWGDKKSAHLEHLIHRFPTLSFVGKCGRDCRPASRGCDNSCGWLFSP